MERKRNKFEIKEKYINIFLYVFLGLGGLWHILDVFQGVMSAIAGYIMILLAVLNVVKYYTLNEQKIDTGKYFIFVILVIFGSFILEYVGVKTGIIFGIYDYGDELQPQINEVPIAIGFAWILVLLSSKAVLGSFFKSFYRMNFILQSLLIGFYMTVFDVFMEPAAIALDYWNWASISAPLQNYIAWFLFGFIFALIGHFLKVLKYKDSSIAVHSFYAQILYFILIYLK